jgi:hypothetical protein
MLTPLDDYLVHQTSDTVDHVATSDRNFYDRYYFGANTIDGSAVMIVALGLYPNVGVIDAFATIVIDNKTQYIVRASRELGADRMDTTVGPLGVEVVEPLRKTRVFAQPNDHDFHFDLMFEGITFPFQEPHFFRRSGNRTIMDYTRMTQNGRWAGSLTVGGRTYDVDPATWWGAKDHSWGIRPLGGDPPAAPVRDSGPAGFFWTWTPMQFDKASMMYTCSEDGDGSRWHTASELLYRDAGKAPEPLTVVGHELKLRSGTRLFDSGTLRMARRDGAPVTVTMKPKSTLYMAGAGYAYLGGWRHAQYHGPLVIEGETWDLSDPATVAKAGVHTQTVCDFRIDGIDGLGVGHGVFEFLSLGAYLPYGFKTWSDVAG